MLMKGDANIVIFAQLTKFLKFCQLSLLDTEMHLTVFTIKINM